MAKFSDNAMAAIQWDEINLGLGTLAAGAIIAANSRIDQTRLQGYRILKSQYVFVCTGLTSDEGPLRMLFAHDLTNTEAEEAIGADPQRSNDPTNDASARTKRPLWPLDNGVFFQNAEGNGRLVAQGEIKLGWSIQEGTVLKFMVENFSGNALTTGATVTGRVKHFGVWLRD